MPYITLNSAEPIAPEDPALYAAGAQRLIKDGYLPPPVTEVGLVHLDDELEQG